MPLTRQVFTQSHIARVDTPYLPVSNAHFPLTGEGNIVTAFRHGVKVYKPARLLVVERYTLGNLQGGATFWTGGYLKLFKVRLTVFTRVNP
jgi:rhodanese-related sulfurtransferase